MSQLGQTRKSALATAMSAFLPIATKLRTSREVRFVPGPDPWTLRHRLPEAILEPAEWQLNVVVGLNKAYNNRDRLKGNLL